MVYDLLFRTAAETLLTIAPPGLSRGGGISLEPAPAEAGGTHWVHCRPGFLLPVRVLSHLFRRLFLTPLADAHAAGRLAFFGEFDGLRGRPVFAAYLAPLRKKNWFVYGKPPFARPEAVLAYLARYTHRVAISNSRLIGLDDRGVTFGFKDYRRNGPARHRTMTLAPGEFIRRFLLHVLPKGFHRIRHYGLLASATCKATIARAKELIAAPVAQMDRSTEHGEGRPEERTRRGRDKERKGDDGNGTGGPGEQDAARDERDGRGGRATRGREGTRARRQRKTARGDSAREQERARPTTRDGTRRGERGREAARAGEEQGNRGEERTQREGEANASEAAEKRRGGARRAERAGGRARRGNARGSGEGGRGREGGEGE